MVCLSCIVFSIGMVVIIKYIYLLICFIIKHVIQPKNNLKEKYGDGYVIITGGSRGIGLSFAKEFLKLNYKICLISSNKEKLEKVKKELSSLYPDSTIKIIDFNLDQFYTEETLKQLEQRITSELNGEEISILYNNAGVGKRGKFDAISQKNITTMINVNIIGLTLLTKIVIEYMKKRKQKSLIFGSGRCTI